MFIDSHCHLNLLAQEEGGLDAVIKQSQDNDVDHILSIAIDIKSSNKTIRIAEKYPNITASVGIHPNVDKKESITIEELINLASHDKVIAIGETGLDYFRNGVKLEWQRERFRTHIEVAKKLKKPLIIHTREARSDTMDILEQEHANQVGGIIHCFTEDWETAKRALDIGFYISLSGIVTFKNAIILQKIAKKLPLDRMLIETDSPYLAPVPYRGKINKPALIKYIAKFIADLRGDTISNIAIETSYNFKKLFSISCL